MILTEEDLEGARLYSMEPEVRFRYVERIVQERVAKASRQEFPAYDDFDYMAAVLAAAKVFGVTELCDWKLPSRTDDSWHDQCQSFRGEAMRVSMEIMLRHKSKPESDPDTVELDPKSKEKMKFHLRQISNAVEESDVPGWKKDELRSALAALEKEIDKASFRVAEIVAQLCKVVGLSDRITAAAEKLMTVMLETKQAYTKRLPADPAPKQIEDKRPKQPQGGKGFDRALSDDIPF